MSKANLNNIIGINLCFVTHSPFILSDIPDTNILFLHVDKETNKSIRINKMERTFGGNIHDMLKDNFYLDNGFMGEFSKRKIQSAIDYLTDSEKIPDQRWTKESIRNFITLIGEPLIRDSLYDLYTQKFVNTRTEIEHEIAQLQNRLNSDFD
jgi:hypothetical protein